jgi:hypothetical protein
MHFHHCHVFLLPCFITVFFDSKEFFSFTLILQNTLCSLCDSFLLQGVYRHRSPCRLRVGIVPSNSRICFVIVSSYCRWHPSSSFPPSVHGVSFVIVSSYCNWRPSSSFPLTVQWCPSSSFPLTVHGVLRHCFLLLYNSVLRHRFLLL